VWFAGFPRPADVTLDANELHYSGLQLTGTTGSTIRHAHKILNYLASGRLDVTPIITHHFKLEDARQALALGASQGDSLKIVLEP
jgi:L-iditol 2-dehydrogenase